MPRPVTTVLAALALGLLAPAAAQAATYTVDGTAAAGCSGTTCKTIKDAVGKAGDGDTINVNAFAGVDTEAGPIIIKQQNLTISATLGTVAVTSSDTTAGDSVFQLGDNSGTDGKGTTLKGLVIASPANGGAAVDVQAQGTTVSTSYLARQGAASGAGDTPDYRADRYTGAGTNTLANSFVVQTPSGTSLTGAGVLGSASSGLILTDDAIASSAGPGVSIPGASATAGDASTLQRDTIVATTADALAVTQAATAANPLDVSVDSTILDGGSAGADLDVSNLAGVTPTDTAAATKVTVVHGSLAGGKNSVVAAENSVGVTLSPPSGVEVDLDRSIIHGPALATHAAGNPPLTAGNTSAIKIQNSDTDVAASTTTGQTITLTQPIVTNSDAADFADVAGHNLHIRLGAPVIDKAGGVGAGESAKDVDGDPRVVGAQSDYGADEFVEHAPVAAFKVDHASVAPGAAVGFDGSASADPDPGDKVASYHWDFGDGTTADTTTPTTSHAYAAAGAFNATLTATDTVGTASAVSAPTVITVAVAGGGPGGGGNPPSLTITTPKKSQTIALRGKPTKKSKKGALKKISFGGTASGGSGVKYVILVLQRVSLTKTAAKSAKTCTYFDGKSAFAGRPCTKPTVFLAKLASGKWSYPLSKKVTPRAGKYTLIAAAVGNDGSTSAAQSVGFTLK